MFEILQNIDISIFEFINQDLSNSFFDNIIPWFRNKYFWSPLYVFLIVYTILKYKKHAYIIILSAVLCLTFADQISSNFAKPFFERERPCNIDVLSENIHVLAPCRNSYSFTSSHATNHFAIACFFVLIYRKKIRRKIRILWFWAALVSLSQVYVGLHFFGDILAGSLLGCSISYVVVKALNIFYLSPLSVNLGPDNV